MSDVLDDTPVTAPVVAESLPCRTFVTGLFGRGGLRGTLDEVWSALLLRNHGTEAHTQAEWQAIITDYGNAPAYADPGVHRKGG